MVVVEILLILLLFLLGGCGSKDLSPPEKHDHVSFDKTRSVYVFDKSRSSKLIEDSKLWLTLNQPEGDQRLAEIEVWAKPKLGSESTAKESVRLPLSLWDKEFRRSLKTKLELENYDLSLLELRGECEAMRLTAKSSLAAPKISTVDALFCESEITKLDTLAKVRNLSLKLGYDKES